MEAAQPPRQAEVEASRGESAVRLRPELREPEAGAEAALAQVLLASRLQAARLLAAQAPASAQRQMTEALEARASGPEAQSSASAQLGAQRVSQVEAAPQLPFSA